MSERDPSEASRLLALQEATPYGGSPWARFEMQAQIAKLTAQRDALLEAAEAVVAAWSETAWESDAVMAALDLLENAIAEARK